MVGRFGAGNLDIAAHSIRARAVFLALIELTWLDLDSGPLIDRIVFLAHQCGCRRDANAAEDLAA